MVKQIQNSVRRLPKKHKLTISGISLFLLTLIIWPSEQATASRQHASDISSVSETIDVSNSNILEVGKRYALPLNLELDPFPDETNIELEWKHYTIQSGDSLARVFSKLGLSANQLHQLTQADPKHTLRRVHPGNTIRIAVSPENQITELRYALSQAETFVIYFEPETQKYAHKIEAKEFESRIEYAQATIQSNFWNAGVEAGLSQAQIMNLAELFGWDIDFALDIRQGDRFAILYEQKFIDGEYVGTGHIVAAEFVNQKETFTAIRHENGHYYTPEGKNMRKSFLRAPVHFTRVSSTFNPRRLHPVTGRVAPHNGIDYAAATGTPVMASGDGKVIASAYSSLNGNYIFIQHGERYVTKYLHLSAKHVKNGARVRQGQVIGKVGATGRVTGPHLHYEFLVDGVHRNPRTVNLPQAESLPAKELASFTAYADQYLALLQTRQRVFYALNEP